MKKLFAVLAVVLLVSALAAPALAADKVYAIVAKDVNNPYMVKAYDGFAAACEEIGAEALYRGPSQPTPEAQIDSGIRPPRYGPAGSYIKNYTTEGSF